MYAAAPTPPPRVCMGCGMHGHAAPRWCPSPWVACGLDPHGCTGAPCDFLSARCNFSYSSRNRSRLLSPTSSCSTCVRRSDGPAGSHACGSALAASPQGGRTLGTSDVSAKTARLFSTRGQPKCCGRHAPQAGPASSAATWRLCTAAQHRSADGCAPHLLEVTLQRLVGAGLESIAIRAFPAAVLRHPACGRRRKKGPRTRWVFR